MKIGNTHVRTSYRDVEGKVGERLFRLCPRDSFEVSMSKARYIRSKVISGKVVLPEGFNLFWIENDGSLKGFK